MTKTFRCDDKETLVAYLYDEIDHQLRCDVAAHLRTCAACASEVEALHSVRRDLAAWQPPEAELNFAITQKPATILRPSRWSARSIPAWMQVAAAVLVLAAGAAIANLQLRYGSDGLTISTGWMHAPTSPIAVTAPVSDDWRPVLTALESDLRREMQMLRSTPSAPAPAPRAAAASVDADALLRRVQVLVTESERRQQQELAVRMAQLGRDVQSDLFRINQGFRQLQGQTRAVEGNQREIVNFVRRVSTQQVP
jgi:hypothetical protein